MTCTSMADRDMHICSWLRHAHLWLALICTSMAGLDLCLCRGSMPAPIQVLSLRRAATDPLLADTRDRDHFLRSNEPCCHTWGKRHQAVTALLTSKLLQTMVCLQVGSPPSEMTWTPPGHKGTPFSASKPSPNSQVLPHMTGMFHAQRLCRFLHCLACFHNA